MFINRFYFPDTSATSVLLTDLSTHLAACGHSVSVYTSRQLYRNPSANLNSNENIDNVKIYRVWSTRYGRYKILGRLLDSITFYLSSAWQILKRISKDDCVIVMTDPPLISVFASWIAWVRGAKTINWVQDVFPEIALRLDLAAINKFISKPLRWIRNHCLAHAHVNIVLSSDMADYFLQEGIQAGKITIIHNWANGNKIFPLLNQNNPLREKWGFAGKFVIGYSGNLGRVHEFDTVLEAASLLNTEKNISFLFIGDGAMLQRIREQSKGLGLTNVHFKPYQSLEDLSTSLNVPDIHLVTLNPTLRSLVVPSKFYGILAAGKPIIFIGGESTELGTIVEREGCGFTLRKGEHSVLATRMKELSENIPLCKEMGGKARTVFESQFNREIAMQAWSQVFENHLDKKEVRPG